MNFIWVSPCKIRKEAETSRQSTMEMHMGNRGQPGRDDLYDVARYGSLHTIAPNISTRHFFRMRTATRKRFTIYITIRFCSRFNPVVSSCCGPVSFAAALSLSFLSFFLFEGLSFGDFCGQYTGISFFSAEICYSVLGKSHA